MGRPRQKLPPKNKKPRTHELVARPDSKRNPTPAQVLRLSEPSNKSSRKPKAKTAAPIIASGYLTPDARKLVPGEGILAYIFTDDVQKAESVTIDVTGTDDVTVNDEKDAVASVDNSETGFISFGSDDEQEAPSLAEALSKQFEDYEEELETESTPPVQEPKHYVALSLPTYDHPWTVSRKHLALNEQLNKEVLDFVDYVRPTRSELDDRSHLIHRIQRLVTGMFPYAEADVFGSSVTGLYLPGADIDMVVNSSQQRLNSPRTMYRLSDKIRQNGWSKSLEVIRGARIPLIKFVDRRSDLQVDISFEQHGGLKAVPVVQQWLSEMPAIRPLVLLLKQFLKRRKLNEPHHGGLGGFATICMVTSFLKNHELIKSGQINPIDNLGVLLMDFFKFYGEDFDNNRYALNMSGQMRIVDRRAAKIPLPDHGACLIYIQDPNDSTNNVTRSTYNYRGVKKEFSHALDLMRRVCSEFADKNPKHRSDLSFLSALLKHSGNAPRYHRVGDENALNLPGQTKKEKKEKKEKKQRLSLHEELTTKKSKDKKKRKDKSGDSRQSSVQPSLESRIEPPTKSQVTAGELFEALSSSESSGGEQKSSHVVDLVSSSEDERDSRVRTTTADRRKYWLKKSGQVEN